MAELAYTRAEEILHCATHVLGVTGALVAIPWLASVAWTGGDSRRVLSGIVYSA